MKKILLILKKNRVLLLLGAVYLIIYFWQNQIGAFLSQEPIQEMIGNAVYEGWLGLVDYLSAHVLFCLIPAFFVAGAVNTLVRPKSIFKYLGSESKKWLAYFIASLSGLLVQVCSCTILPLFAGIWKRGAGLGVASTFLYAGPAVNLLTLILTGQRIGWGFAVVRFVLSIGFAILTGLIMEGVFGNGRDKDADFMTLAQENSLQGRKALWFWIVLLGILIAGTAPIGSQLKHILVFALTAVQLFISFTWLTADERGSWWQETVKFLNQIIPLLLAGVFLASAATYLIPQEQFQNLTSQNTLLTNFAAVMFGAIAYFPALVEVPIAENFMKLGMNQGPLMAYLLSDPVLSLQGLLIIRKLIGTKKTLVYAGAVIVLTTLAGFIYGGLV